MRADLAKAGRSCFPLAALLVSIAGALGGCGTTAPAAAPGGPVPLLPASGVLFGARVDPGPALTRAERMAAVIRLELDLGRLLAIHHHAYTWEQPYPADLEYWDVAVGRFPLISWGGTDAAAITAGQFDAMIAQRAKAVKRLGAPVFLRWFGGMNAPRHAAGPGSPADYIRAWQHIWQIFRAQGATNAVWVWCPSADGFPEADRYYPGDAYVDWVCAEGFNRGGPQWRAFATIFQPFYAEWAGHKPLMVAETGTVEHGGDKAGWIAEAGAALQARFPAIKALVYRDAVSTTAGVSDDWRVTSSARAFGAYKAMAADPYFNPLPGPTR